MHFGAKVRVIRALRRVTQDALARELHMPASTLSVIESERVTPNEHMMAAIMTAPSLRWPPRADEAFALLVEE